MTQEEKDELKLAAFKKHAQWIIATNPEDKSVYLLKDKTDLFMKVVGMNHFIPSKVFRILTKTGMIGWAYMRQNDAVEAEG